MIGQARARGVMGSCRCLISASLRALQLPGCNGSNRNPLEPLIALLVSHFCRQPPSRTPRGRVGRVQASAIGHTAARQRCDSKRPLVTVCEHSGCCEWPSGIACLLISLQRLMARRGQFGAQANPVRWAICCPLPPCTRRCLCAQWRTRSNDVMPNDPPMLVPITAR